MDVYNFLLTYWDWWIFFGFLVATGIELHDNDPFGFNSFIHFIVTLAVWPSMLLMLWLKVNRKALTN